MAIVSAGAKLLECTLWLRRGAGGLSARVSAHPALMLVPLFALLVLLGLSFPQRPDDEAGYLEIARNLMHGHYATGRPDALLDANPAYPDIWFGPGLPLALVGPVALGLPLALIRLTGPLFLSLALLVFFRLMQCYLRPKAALVSTWALGLYLPFYTLLPNLHSEPLAVLFVVVALYAAARLSEDGSRTWLVSGALALAGLALTRVDYGWVLTLALVALVVWWALSRSRTARRLAGMYALGLALCVPWLAYTYSQTHRFYEWGNSGSLSLYWMSSPYAHEYGDWQQANAVFTDDNLAAHRPFFEELRGLTLPHQNVKLERRAFENIRDHPLKYLENIVANSSRMFFDAPYSYSRQRLGALYFALPNALLLAALVLAATVAVRVRGSLPPPTAAFALFALAAFSIHALVAAYPRMLMPIVPVIIWFVTTTLGRHVQVVRPEARASG